eukprot:1150926-Pelagomonas_calceolata.AAC.2
MEGVRAFCTPRFTLGPGDLLGGWLSRCDLKDCAEGTRDDAQANANVKAGLGDFLFCGSADLACDLHVSRPSCDFHVSDLACDFHVSDLACDFHVSRP